MWHDNETRTDLLGFDYLVDELEVLLTERRLLPLTIGIDGGWGSGKSSLMEMTRARLESAENAGRFICVCFNPWRFEDFSHGKVGLMAAIVDAIGDRIEEDSGRFQVTVEKANALRRRLHRWGLFHQTAMFAAGAAGAGSEEAAGVGRVDHDALTRAGLPDEHRGALRATKYLKRPLLLGAQRAADPLRNLAHRHGAGLVAYRRAGAGCHLAHARLYRQLHAPDLAGRHAPVLQLDHVTGGDQLADVLRDPVRCKLPDALLKHARS
jgi:KAP family P-loop domain